MSLEAHWRARIERLESLIAYLKTGGGVLGGDVTGPDAATVLSKIAALAGGGIQTVGVNNAGTIIAAPPSEENVLNLVTDFGADPTGVTLSNTALAAAQAAAVFGDTIFVPVGVFRYNVTWGPFAPGVTLEGAGGAHLGVSFFGSVLQYEGLGDGVRMGVSINANVATDQVVKNLLIRCNNDNNQAPQRQSPSRTLSGVVASVANLGGLVEIGMSLPHGLLTGNLVAVDSVTGTVEANGGWTATVIDATHFTIPVAFVNAWTGGGNVRMRCGAGLVAIGSAKFEWNGVYCSGFGVGFMMDGTEVATVIKCQADGYADNGSLGSNSKRLSAGIWYTDGDSGCNGWTVPGSTNAHHLQDCDWNGCRTGILIDGIASAHITRCTSNNIGGAGLLNTPVTGVINAAGQIELTAVGHGLLTGDYAGVGSLGPPSIVGGVPNATGEWVVTKVDNNHIILNGSVFAGAFTSGGIVSGFAPATLARINRAESLCFDTCYSEGIGDAHFMFDRQTGSSSALVSTAVQIRDHFAAGDCPAIMCANAAASCLSLFSNFWATRQSVGAGKITGYHVRTGNLFSSGLALPGQGFWDGPTSATGGLVSDFNENVNPYGNGTTGEPTANWEIALQDFATSLLRCSDPLPAFYLDFRVPSIHSSYFDRSVNSPGFGDKAGVSDDIVSASLAAGAAGTVIATSEVVPPYSNGYFEITITAHRDDDDATKGATWIFHGTMGQVLAGTLTAIDGPTLGYTFNGDPGGFVTPVVTELGSTFIVTALGNTTQASTWTTRFEFTKTQRSR